VFNLDRQCEIPAERRQSLCLKARAQWAKLGLRWLPGFGKPRFPRRGSFALSSLLAGETLLLGLLPPLIFFAFRG
jgi:hypothetical protein